ncbi:MAG: hypothetical protein AAGC60_13840 [Acidobacteriota bacterium]
MLPLTATHTEQDSPAFEQSKRKGNETNLTWLDRHLEILEGEDGADGQTYLVLLGGREKSHFRLRVAQSHMRHDMSPSHWSHVAMLWGSGRTEKGALREISLEPTDGFRFPPSDNGIQTGKLAAYRSRNLFPNIAVLRVPVALQDMKTAMRRFRTQRDSIDAVELIVLWLSYAWGVGRTLNPLLDGYGIPSAAFVETLSAASGYDLTPGLESRASSPEAIWQAAKWWHEWYAAGERAPHRGFWHAEHFLG